MIALTREHISHPRCLRWRFDLSDPAAGRFKNTAFRTGKATAFGTQRTVCVSRTTRACLEETATVHACLYLLGITLAITSGYYVTRKYHDVCVGHLLF